MLNTDGTDGPDLIEIGYFGYRPLHILTGAGSDTVRYTLDYNQYGVPNSWVILDDFTPGNGGDVIDIMPFLSGYLNGALGWSPGRNPFETGHLALLQDGADVKLTIDRDGDAHAGGFPVAIFPNHQLAEFTSANFLGVTLQGPSPTETRLLRSDTVIPPGNLTIDIPDLYYASGPIPDRPVFILLLDARLTNHGTVTITDTHLPQGEPHEQLIGVANFSSGSFINASDGHFLVRRTFTSPGYPQFDGTYGVFDARGPSSFVNDGLLEVRSAQGSTYGYHALSLTSGTPDISNSGTLLVTSGYDAYGIHSLGQRTLENSGFISVEGSHAAYGVYFGSVISNATLLNSGVIEAHTDPTSPEGSVGIYLWEVGAARPW